MIALIAASRKKSVVPNGRSAAGKRRREDNGFRTGKAATRRGDVV
jgi:hypothetical protein